MSSQQAYAAPRPLHKTGPSSSSAPYPSLSSGSTAPRPLHLHQQRACNFAANCIKKKDTCRFWHPGEPIAFYACLFDPNCRDKGKNCLFWHNGQPLPEGGVLPSSKGRGQDSKESAHKGPLHSMIACNTYQHCKKPAGQCKYWHSGDPVPAGGIRRSAAKKSNKFAASASSTISALSPEPTSQIYGGYEGPHVEYDINASRREILAQLTQHKLLLLRSHNGSGAATLLSQYLAEEFGSYGLVVQLQSSEASVGTVARQISLEFEGKEPGHFVAYHTASKRRTTFDAKTTSAVSWGNDTRIVVMSAAEFVRMCRDSNWLSRLSAVVCMDTHLRCMYTDVSMALCKQYIHQQHRLLLVASSAMVDDPALCSFLDASFDVPLSTLRVIRPSECLSIEYMPPNKNSTDERDANDILAESVLRALQYHLIRNNIPGNAIVYLPAPDDHAVAAFTSLLNQEKIRNTDLALIQVQELHELLSFDHQVAVSRWTPEKLGQRLVVFATDFATSSVSVPNVSLVIDTGTVSRTRNETLETVPVSKAMAELRKLSCAVFELALGPPSTLVWPFGSNSIAAKARTFRAILNKITPVTFENLVDMLLEVPVEDPETLNSLVEVIVDVAVSEPKLCAIYAKLCSRMAIAFKFEQEAEDGTKYAITFRSVLLNKCQGLFSDRHAIHIPEWLAEVERRKCEILEFKRRSQLLSLVKFVAELANHSVLSMNVVPQILDQLWAAKLGYEDLELFTVVLSTSGKQLPSANLFVQKCRDWIKEFTEREVQDSEGIRIRYLMQNTADLADMNWVHREASSAAQGPKTLDEIRDDIAKKEKMLENELKNMKRGPVSGGRLAQPVPTKAGGRGPSSFSVMQRDAPRTPSSPSQGGRGKASFTAQSGGANGAFSPARGSSSSNATPAASVTSAHTLSNAFDSLMIDSQFDPNFLTASNSSAPRDDSEVESTRGTAEGEMDVEALDEALEEFLDSAVPEDAVETIADGPAVEESCVYFISNLLLKVFDTTPDKKRDDWAVNLLTLFVKNTDYGLSDTDRTVVPGLVSTVEQLDSLDSPLAPGRLGTILGECLNRKIILPNAINKILAPLTGDENAKRAMQVIVSMWKRVTPTEVAGFIKASGFNISAWKIPDSELPESMKQQMETADGLLKRGVDILEVVVWAKKAGSPSLRDMRFIEKLMTRLSEESRTAATTKAPLDETKFGPSVSAILSAANNDLQRQIATSAITTFASKPSQGVPLFTLLVNNGLAKKTIMDAAEKKGDNYLFDPQFTSWGYSGAAAAAAATSSSSKGGKGGKGKKKK